MTFFKEKATMLGVTMPNHNQPNIDSQDDSTYSSTKGLGVVACVDPLDFISFMSSISQETLGAIVTIGPNFPLKKNLILCNYSICDYMQLIVIYNYVLSFLQLVTIIYNLLL